MGPVVIVFASRHGASRQIAGRLAARLVAHRVPIDVIDASAPGRTPLAGASAALLVGGVMMGRFPGPLVDFARKHHAALARIPTVFVPVSVGHAVVDDPLTLPSRRAQAAAEGLRAVARFVRSTSWQPDRIVPVAGTLAYRRYPNTLRVIMRAIAWRMGAPTDTTRDHVLTDWRAVNAIADRLVADLYPPSARRSARSQAAAVAPEAHTSTPASAELRGVSTRTPPTWPGGMSSRTARA